MVLEYEIAKKIIEDAQKYLTFFKGKRNKCKLALNESLKKRPHYKKYRQIYQTLKPFINGEKNLSSLKNEDFLQENQDDIQRRKLEEKMALSVNRARGGIYQPH
ncbi:hypothetical protein KC901_01915 [Patescibacteria group bacterium]|nr:hypothetical protein [Patescibacteria group bacterium]